MDLYIFLVPLTFQWNLLAKAAHELSDRRKEIFSNAGGNPLEIDLEPVDEVLYFCYNCGSKNHGAASCTHPPRGTRGNVYCPNFPGAPVNVFPEWICARSHHRHSKEIQGPNDMIITTLQKLQDTYEDNENPVQ